MSEGNGVVLSIQNYKGGVGKTTISMNMSYILAMAGYKVLFVDLDEQGSASESMRVHDANGKYLNNLDIIDLDLLSLLTKPVDINQYIFFTKYENIDIIPNARLINEEDSFDVLFKEVNLPTEDKLMALYNNLQPIRACYDYIIIDGQPHLGRMMDVALCASDAVITPLECNKYNVNPIMDVMERIMFLNDKYGVNTEFLGFFANKYIPMHEPAYQKFLEKHRGHFIEHPIRLSSNVSENSVNKGKMFLEHSKKSNPSIDLLHLVINELEMVDEEHKSILEKNGIPRSYYEKNS